MYGYYKYISHIKTTPPLLLKCQRPRECKEKGGWLGGGLNQTAYQRPRECKDKGGGFNQTAYSGTIDLDIEDFKADFFCLTLFFFMFKS